MTLFFQSDVFEPLDSSTTTTTTTIITTSDGALAEAPEVLKVVKEEPKQDEPKADEGDDSAAKANLDSDDGNKVDLMATMVPSIVLLVTSEKGKTAQCIDPFGDA